MHITNKCVHYESFLVANTYEHLNDRRETDVSLPYSALGNSQQLYVKYNGELWLLL